ncbi:nitroreductase family protein [Brucepastera parasyntrophica]|uniref:nitroreductase family protein n=1 Tax=Brucepastera parasyntrophica TaxID=2880008 RepID=UPI00210C0960|nr:nitroreductase family protein [Brucepastera parasyntrophica]ULQ60503.1 nitroreductase family protein [Brucepastera parasyntrophica]
MAEMQRLKIIIGAVLFLLAAVPFCAQGNSEPASSAPDTMSGASESISSGEQAEMLRPGTNSAAGDAQPSSIFARTTARAFAQTPVTEARIEDLLRAAFASPTGGNQRAWEFIIITDHSVMKAIQAGHPYAQALSSAPLLIVIAEDTSAARYPELLEFDSGIAVQAILVRAAELGLSSVAMSVAPQEKRIRAVARAASLPDTVIPHMMIALGYPASDAVSSASVSFYDARKVHRNRY